MSPDTFHNSDDPAQSVKKHPLSCTASNNIATCISYNTWQTKSKKLENYVVSESSKYCNTNSLIGAVTILWYVPSL